MAHEEVKCNQYHGDKTYNLCITSYIPNMHWLVN